MIFADNTLPTPHSLQGKMKKMVLDDYPQKMNSNCRKQVTGKICYSSRGRWNKSPTKTKDRTTSFPLLTQPIPSESRFHGTLLHSNTQQEAKPDFSEDTQSFWMNKTYSLTSCFFPSHKRSCLHNRYFNCIDALFCKHWILMLVSLLKWQSTRRVFPKSSSLKYTRIQCRSCMH